MKIFQKVVNIKQLSIAPDNARIFLQDSSDTRHTLVKYGENYLLLDSRGDYTFIDQPFLDSHQIYVKLTPRKREK